MNSYNSVLIKMRWCQYRCIYIAESVFDGEVIGMNFLLAPPLLSIFLIYCSMA